MAQVFTIDGSQHTGNKEDDDVQYVTDRGGNSLRLRLYNGVYHQCFRNMQLFKKIKDFKMKPEDIYFPGYMRTGTHWVFELTSMLLNQKAETIKLWKGSSQIDVSPQEFLDELPSPRVLGTHARLSDSPTDVKSLKCKTLYTLRDPRDAALSMYKMAIDVISLSEYTGKFEDFFYLYLQGKMDGNGYFEHMLDAEKFFQTNPDVPLHVLVYEEILANPVHALLELSTFLGVPRNEDLCKEIAEKCNFSKMVQDKDKYTLKLDGKSIIFGQGVSGRWREHFTDEMLEDYYRVYEEKMAGSRFYRKEYARPAYN